MGASEGGKINQRVCVMTVRAKILQVFQQHDSLQVRIRYTHNEQEETISFPLGTTKPAARSVIRALCVDKETEITKGRSLDGFVGEEIS